MTRINNADHVLTLLRDHLERTRKSRKRDQPIAPRDRHSNQGPVERVLHLARVEALPSTELARALIAGLLTEEFGDAVANDPGFQRMVGDVQRTIEADERGRALMQKAITQLTNRGA